MDKVMRKAAEHLSKHDLVLAPIIKKAGLCDIQPHKDYYWELVDSIISQQLSIKAARSIETRFLALYPGAMPAPEQILETPHETLRSVGLSNAKANYVRDLAQHIVEGELELEKLDKLSNDEIIAELTAVKGIGEWTAHMFLMFAMARLDILAVGDLGIKIGIRGLYGLDHLPSAEGIKQISEKNHWAPYETIACWYIWHTKDNS
jgi:DNA-3-methyladenine glycosylase II